MTLTSWDSLNLPDPIVGDDKQITFRRKVTQFGDGYKEISASGINSKQKNGSLVFIGLTDTQLDDAIAFLDARAGLTPFTITLPSEAATTTVLVESYNYKTMKGSRFELTFQYRQFYPTS